MSYHPREMSKLVTLQSSFRHQLPVGFLNQDLFSGNSIKKWEEGVLVLEKVGFPLFKVNIFQRFKYQRNRTDSTVRLVFEMLKSIDLGWGFPFFSKTITSTPHIFMFMAYALPHLAFYLSVTIFF